MNAVRRLALGVCLWLPLLTAAQAVETLATEPAAVPVESAAPVLADGSAPQAAEPLQRRSRLKFRDGPACMCPQGLSERDIAAGRSDKPSKNEEIGESTP